MLVTDDTMRDGLFFAYPGKPDLRAETLREAADHLGAVTGVECETWEGLDVDGRLIIGRITEAIDRADTLVAEVGTLNSNVLFEVGYALARGKHIRLLIDETDATALRHWKDFGLLQSIGRIDYGGSAENPRPAVDVSSARCRLGAPMGRPRPRCSSAGSQVGLLFGGTRGIYLGYSRRSS